MNTNYSAYGVQNENWGESNKAESSSTSTDLDPDERSQKVILFFQTCQNFPSIFPIVFSAPLDLLNNLLKNNVFCYTNKFHSVQFEMGQSGAVGVSDSSDKSKEKAPDQKVAPL